MKDVHIHTESLLIPTARNNSKKSWSAVIMAQDSFLCIIGFVYIKEGSVEKYNVA